MAGTLRRELIAALALVFAGALFVGAAAVAVLLPRFQSPLEAALVIGVLLLCDVAVFALFGRYLVQRRVLEPLERMIDGAQAVAAGDLTGRLPSAEPRELALLADAVNQMADRMITVQKQLSANIRSLDETNLQLTEARDELIHAEKMASVGRLAAGIAHEVGNPLGAILGYLSLLGRGASEQQKELAAAAEREARRIDRIVRGLLDYARPREMAPRPLDVNLVVGQTVELLSTQGRMADIRVDLDLEPDLTEVVAEPYQLQQVLVNLLLNAADALEGRDAPVVTIQTRPGTFRSAAPLPARRAGDPPEVDYTHRRRFHQTPKLPREAPFAPGDALVELRVSDNGPGIEPEIMGHIFDPFVTSKEPGRGTGLGLAVASRLIDAMGGTIHAESRPGEGATFTLVLPAESAAVRELART